MMLQSKKTGTISNKRPIRWWKSPRKYSLSGKHQSLWTANRNFLQLGHSHHSVRSL